MSMPFRFGTAASLVTLSTMIAGCAAPQSSGIREVKQGDVGLATRAYMAMSANNLPSAIDFAERAVAKTPDDAGFRALLGNAYFAAGRFASAEAAYKDALTIYSDQPQVILKLALAQIAQGKKDEAIAFLQAASSVVSPADYGLAIALAGHPKEAVSILETAARSEGADARVRQNLALAYGLSGDWTEARTIAAQDVPANELEGRLQQWMLFANPKLPAEQVASLVGVTPAAVDPGQPLRLALNKADTRMAQATAPAPAPVAAPQPQVAQAAPPPPATAPAAAPVMAKVAEAAPAPPAPIAAADSSTPTPQFAAAAPAPPPVDEHRVAAQPESSAPVTMALLAAASKAETAVANFFHAKAEPAPNPVRRVPAAAPRPALRNGNSTAVVQIGAYSSAQRVTAAWNNAARRYGMLKAYMPMSARFNSAKGVFYRLSVKGFNNASEAKALCEQLRRNGGTCFVRNFAGDAPVQYAMR
jgi:Flp pilus assembly protein TadD